MENNHPETPTTHLLDDFDYQYVQASGNTRFCNLLVDQGLLYGVWRLIIYKFTYPLGMLVYTLSGGETWAIYLLSYLLAILFYLLYFAFFEYTTGGKTIGKYLTRTRAVTADGRRMNFGQTLLRNLLRFVPFEAFSALGKPSYPWHDRWSKTLVIDESQTQLPPWE